MPSLVRANIFQRKTRAAIAILAVAVQVTAVLLIVGLTNGTLEEVSQRMRNIGADIMFTPPGGSPLLGLSDTTMTAAAAERLLEIDGVASASPVMVWATADLTGSPVNIFGIVPERFESVGGRIELLEGRRLRGGYDLIVDQRLADAQRFDVGQRQTILNHDWTIVGVYRPGVGTRAFVHLATLQDLLGLPGKVHVVFVKVDEGDIPEEIAARIEAAFPGYKANLLDQYTDVLRENVVGLNHVNTALSSIAVVLSFLVILLAMYTSIIERTREIGILKALGASKIYIMRAIVSESLLLCAAGVVGGIGMAYLGREILLSGFPTLTVDLTAKWIAYATLLGFTGGVLGSFYPALRAAREDPVRALRYE